MIKKFSLGEDFLKERGHYVKKNYTYLVSLCLHEQVGDTIVDGWPPFECDSNVFADMILPYSSHCIDMTSSPEPGNSVIGMWLSCFAMCDWLRAESISCHDHNIDDQNMVVLPIVRGQLAMITEENLPSKYNVDEMKSM